MKRFSAAIVAGLAAIALVAVSADAQTSGDIFDQAAAEGHRLQAEVMSLSGQVTTLETTVAERDATIVELLARIAELENPTPSPTVTPSVTTTPSPSPSPSPSPTEPPVACDGVSVAGSIQQAIDANPVGTTFCLFGTYWPNSPILPKDGQTFMGPAFIEAASNTIEAGFDLKTRDSDDVSLINLDVSGFVHGVLVWEGTQIYGGRYHDNIENGIGGGLQYVGGQPVVLDGIEVDHNGDPAFLGNGSGGIKIARLGTGGFILRNSHLHDNLGNGVWCDVQCVGTYLIEHNVVEANSRKGIHYEKSGASDEYAGVGQPCLGCGLPVVEGEAIIRYNTVTGNGTEGREHAADGGIVGVSSRNMHIYGNTTANNRRGGIFLTTDGRLSGEKHGWPAEALIEDNDVSDGIVGCGQWGVVCM